MKKGIICYQSKYGSAFKYANWLQEALDYDCKNIKDIHLQELLPYETVIFCGGIYASGIKGINFLKKHFDEITEKRIAVFCVGASPHDEQALADIKKHNLKDKLQNIPLFYGRGAWDESKMTFVDRSLCQMLQRSIAKKDPSTYEPWMKALMEARGKSVDWCDRLYLKPLLDYLNDVKVRETHSAARN